MITTPVTTTNNDHLTLIIIRNISTLLLIYSEHLQDFIRTMGSVSVSPNALRHTPPPSPSVSVSPNAFCVTLNNPQAQLSPQPQ